MTDAAVAVRWRKARQAVASSRTLLQAGDTEGACNRAYYAMYHAAHAALEAAQIIAPGSVLKTHNGLIAIFSKELVMAGAVDQSLGRSLSKVHDMRLLADYEGDPPDAASAAWAVTEAEAFVLALAPSS